MKNLLLTQPSRHRLAKTVGGTLVVTALAAFSVSPAFAQTTTSEEQTTATTAAETTETTVDDATTSTTTAEETTTTVDTDSGAAPVGGADTGVGGTAVDDGFDPTLLVGAVLGLGAIGAGGTYLVRRRQGAIEA